MALIDSTYFHGRINIAQIEQAAVLERVNDYINLYEPQFLELCLGYEFYQLYLTDILQQRMIDIRDGKTYTYNDREYRWKGLKYTVSSANYSPIADYVYFQLLQDEAEIKAGVGVVTTNTDNATRVSTGRKQTMAWNEMVTQVEQLREYLHRNAATYPEYNRSYTHYFTRVNEFNL